LSGFQTGQINGLALLFPKLSSNVSSVNAIFFGLWLLPLAQLVVACSPSLNLAPPNP
jgi:hypothetical protein